MKPRTKGEKIRAMLIAGVDINEIPKRAGVSLPYCYAIKHEIEREKVRQKAAKSARQKLAKPARRPRTKSAAARMERIERYAMLLARELVRLA